MGFFIQILLLIGRKVNEFGKYAHMKMPKSHKNYVLIRAGNPYKFYVYFSVHFFYILDRNE